MGSYSKFKTWTNKKGTQKLLSKIIFFELIVIPIIIILFSVKNDPTFFGILGESTSTPISTPTMQPIPTETPIPTPTIPTYNYVAPTIDPNPPIHCKISSNCGGGTTPLRQSECNNSVCCQIGDKWIFYKDRNQCINDQNSKNRNTTSGNYNASPSYPPCTVYYPALKYSQTYSYVSTEQCKTWQDTANAGSTSVVQQPTPVPTQDNSEYNDLLKRHQEACNQAAAEWIGVREQWEAANGNNYSSSAEMVMALRQRMTQYQQELYSAGCTQTISL